MSDSDLSKPPSAPHLNAEDSEWKAVPFHVAEMPPLDAEDEDIFSLYKRPQASSVAEYEAALLRHIRLRYAIQYVGSPLVDLNRRFSHLAKAHGVSVRDVVRKLNKAGFLEFSKFEGHIILIPADVYAELTASAEAVTLIDTLCRSSLREIGAKVSEVHKEKTVTKKSSFFEF